MCGKLHAATFILLAARLLVQAATCVPQQVLCEALQIAIHAWVTFMEGA